MIAGTEDRSWVNTGSERMQAMTSYVRAFFRSISTEDFACLIAEAQVNGQQKIVEGLYSAGVVNNIVRAILGRIDKGRSIDDQVNDYIQDATVVLIQIARQGRLDLNKSAGEIASYICLWIEQRVKRVARKDQRWRFSLVDSPDTVEQVPEVWEGPHVDEAPSGDLTDLEACADNKLGAALPQACAKTGPDRIFGHDLRKSERNILSIFGSSRAGER